MKVKVKTTEINKALKILNKIVKTTALCSGVKLETSEKDKLVISASSTNQCMSITIDAKVEKDGSVTTDKKTITDFLIQLEDAETTIENDDNKTLIQNGKIKAFLPQNNDYVKEANKETIENAQIVEVEPEALSEVIRQSIPFCGKDCSNRFNIDIHFGDKEIKAKTTDGNAASVIKKESEKTNDNNAVIFLEDAYSLEALTKYTESQKEKTVQLLLGKNKALFKSKTITSVIRLGEKSPFPIEEKITSLKGEKYIVLDRENIEKTIQRMKCFIETNSSSTPLYINFEKGQATAIIKSILGENNEQIKYIENKDVQDEIAFNIDYLKECLNSADPEVKLYIAGPMKPIVFSFQKADYIMTPLRNKRKNANAA